nr:putative reverse transcriptase domain-containing protein [Tanacetum cinerariifolium]
MKYKAAKVCHEEMVKMPLVDLKVLEYKERYRLRRPVSFGAYGDERVFRIIARAARSTQSQRRSTVAFEDEFKLLKKEKCYVKPNKVWWFYLRMLEALGIRDEECDLDGSRASTTHFQLEGLNMRLRRWMELLSDYGCETKYHMGKANIVVDAWRRKGG